MAIRLGEISAEVTADSRRFTANLGTIRNLGNRFVQGFTNSLRSIGTQFQRIGQIGRSSFTSLASFSQTVRSSMVGMANNAVNGLNQMSSKLKDISGNLREIGDGMLKYITLPISAAGIAIFNLGKNFEKELSKVIGLVGIAEKQVKLWGNEIIKLSPELARSPQELAEALYFVTSAGIRGAEAIDVLKMSGKAAAAGLGETKIVADLVTSAINAYGKENLNAKDAVDMVTMAVREGKTEAAELAGTLGQVLPISSKMGVSFDQVAAAQAAMTKTGTPAAEAATQLKSVLSGLIKPSKQAQDTLEMMGTSAGELRKSIREKGLLNTLIKLSELSSKYGEETIARVFPNIRALLGVFDLTGESMKSNIKTFENVKNSTGTLDKAFKAASKTLDFKWNQALVKVQTTLLGFFDTLKVALIPILDKVSSVLDWVADKFEMLSPGMKSITLAIAAGAALIGPALIAVSVILSGLATAFSVVATVISAVMALFAKITIPILLIIAGVALLIVIITAIIKKFVSLQDIINFVQSAFTTFMTIISSLGEFLMSVFSPVIDILKESLNNIDTKPIIEAFENFKATLPTIITILKELGIVIGVVIVTAIGIVISIINGLINAFSGLVAMILNLVGIVTSVFNIIVGIISGDSELIEDSFKSLWENVKGLFINAGRAILGFIKGFIDSIVKFFQSLYQTLVGGSIVPNMINGIINWFKRLPPRILSFLASLVSSAITKFIQLQSRIISTIASLILSAISRFLQLKSRIVSIIVSLISSTISRWTGIISRFLSIISILSSSAVSKFNSLKSSVVKIIGSIDLAKAGSKIVQSLINGIKGMYGNVTKVTRGLAEKIRDFFPFSPAKEGPLKDIDKIDFYSSLEKSLNNAQSKIKVPATQLSDAIINNIQRNPSVFVNGLDGRGTKTMNFGTLNFYGVQDVYDLMKEIKSLAIKHTGRMI